jgi:hypothetical protein
MRGRVNLADLIRKAQEGTSVLVEARNFCNARAAFAEFTDYIIKNRIPCEIRMYDCRVKFPNGAFIRFITEYAPHEGSGFNGEVIRLWGRASSNPKGPVT